MITKPPFGPGQLFEAVSHVILITTGSAGLEIAS